MIYKIRFGWLCYNNRSLKNWRHYKHLKKSFSCITLCVETKDPNGFFTAWKTSCSQLTMVNFKSCISLHVEILFRHMLKYLNKCCFQWLGSFLQIRILPRIRIVTRRHILIQRLIAWKPFSDWTVSHTSTDSENLEQLWFQDLHLMFVSEYGWWERTTLTARWPPSWSSSKKGSIWEGVQVTRETFFERNLLS